MGDNRILKIINNGSVDHYYGLKFTTKLDFEELVNNIQKKTKVVFDEYDNLIKKPFSSEIVDSIHRAGLDEELHVKNIDTQVLQTNSPNDIYHSIDGIEIEQTETGLKLYPSSKIHNYIDRMYNEDTQAYDHNKKIYGKTYINNHLRIILPPFAATLYNDKVVVIESILYVFSNKSAVLRLSLPLTDVDSQPLFTNKIDTYISSFVNICGMTILPESSTVDALKVCYCQFLINDNKKINTIFSTGTLISIILTRHSTAVTNIRNIPDKLKEDLYRILIAPVPDRKDISYAEDAQNCFKNSSFILNGTCSIFSSTNKCVTLIDESIIEVGRNIYTKESVYNELIIDTRNAIEFTVCILMLKKTNNQYTFIQKGNFSKKALKIQNQYNHDKIFLSLMLSETYGSVRDQIESFEKGMKYFVDQENISMRMDALNNIVEQEKNRKIQKFQSIVSIGGLFFSMLFGLPAITQTTTLLRSLFCFMQTDIPLLSINNVSFGIWLIMNSVFAVHLFINKRK